MKKIFTAILILASTQANAGIFACNADNLLSQQEFGKQVGYCQAVVEAARAGEYEAANKMLSVFASAYGLDNTQQALGKCDNVLERYSFVE